MRIGVMMRYNVIAIEREYASGGQEIGEKLSQKLNIPCYGQEILTMAAEENNWELKHIEDLEERATGSLLFSMYIMTGMASMGKGHPSASASEVFVAQDRVIQRITQTPAIIVGRCAVNSLKDRKDVLRVFIQSDLETRKKRAIDQYGILPKDVDVKLRKADKHRSDYYSINTSINWKDMKNYDIILDSGQLGIDRCADILERCFM